MRILVISPMVYAPSPLIRYGGIERLVYLTASELLRQGHRVTVAAPDPSFFPQGIEHLRTGPCGDFFESERQALYRYQGRLGEFDGILDYSHSKWAMMGRELPALAFIWHDPYLMRPQEPEYGVAALSQWQAERFQVVYDYEARVIDPHCGLAPEPARPGDAFLFIGRVSDPHKGALEAIEVCRELGMPLDLIGAYTREDGPEYITKVRKACWGNINYLGEVSDEEKDAVLARARALIYPLEASYAEAHSHKSVDALLAGVPIITYARGALPEIIEHGVTGLLAESKEDFVESMLDTDEWDRAEIRRRAMARWSTEATARRLVEALEGVRGGQRWGRPKPAAVLQPAAPSAVGFITHTLPPFPRQVRLDTVNSCNARCLPCHIQRSDQKMPRELLEAAVAEMASWEQSPQEVVPVNFGEVLLLPDWEEVLRLISTRLPRTRIALATNASLLDKVATERLASIPTLKWVNLSINAFFAETYQAFTGLPPSVVDRALEAAALLRSMRPDVHLCASMVFEPGSQSEMERDLFRAFWRDKVHEVSINPAQHASNSPLPIPVLLPCRSIVDGLVLFHDGRVGPGCCYSDGHESLVIGHFPEEKLLDIWRGGRLRALLDRHNRGERPHQYICGGCSFA